MTGMYWAPVFWHISCIGVVQNSVVDPDQLSEYGSGSTQVKIE